MLLSRPPFVLGGGCNIVLTGDVKPLVLKIEIAGRAKVGFSVVGRDAAGRPQLIDGERAALALRTAWIHG